MVPRLYFVGWMGLVCAVGCRPGAPSSFVPPVSKVKVQIVNRLGEPLDVYWDDRGKRVSVMRLPSEPGSQQIELGSGKYWVAPTGAERSASVPIPALSDVLRDRPLRVELDRVPAIDDPELVWIPPGPALIGDEIGIGQEDERPARIVDVPGFWLSRYEVTNADFVEFLNAQAKYDPAWIDLRSRKCRMEQDTGGRYATDAPQLPVVMVSLAGARAYCRWRSEQTGRRYRLPTEVEWEKGARGCQSYVFSYGNIYRNGMANQESGQLTEVGRFAPNSFGLYDMTGNAFEWVADPYDRSKRALVEGLDHVLRGGSFVLDGVYLRNSFRMRQSAEVMTDDIGFRVACDAIHTQQPDEGEKE